MNYRRDHAKDRDERRRLKAGEMQAMIS